MATSILFSRAISAIEPGWREFLDRSGFIDEANAILASIESQFIASGTKVPIETVICPEPENIFAFARFPFDKIQIVLIGQDPYPTRANAHGLAFSVPDGVAIPASLRNIFGALVARKQMREAPKNGNLEAWAQQGVVLLNTALTTIEKKIGEHIAQWSAFTRRLAIEIGRAHPGIIYLLLGKAAQKIGADIPRTCAYLAWGHPSPLNPANRDLENKGNFIHCTVFEVANNMLIASSKQPVNWDLAQRSLNAPSICAQKQHGRLEIGMLEPDDDLTGPDDDMIFAFVDGAARSNGKPGATAGFAVFVVQCMTTYQVVGIVDGDKPTNNRAELMALRELFILMCSEEFIARMGRMPMTIIYDSAYAAGCVRVWYESWCKVPPSAIKANIDIISVAHDYMKRAESTRAITWIQVKSHQREPDRDGAMMNWFYWAGNKKVDALASAATGPN